MRMTTNPGHFSCCAIFGILFVGSMITSSLTGHEEPVNAAVALVAFAFNFSWSTGHDDAIGLVEYYYAINQWVQVSSFIRMYCVLCLCVLLIN